MVKQMRIALTALVVCLVAPLGLADDHIPEPDHLEAALAQAGDNRAELEGVLQHYLSLDKQEEHEAARFLIENMPGKGYIVTELRTKQGEVVPYDPLAYKNFKASQAALDVLEKEHGELEFARDQMIEDLKTIKSAFLIKHIDHSFKVWRAAPESRRVSFEAFKQFILPYRGSQEPLGEWLAPLNERYEALVEELGPDADAKTIYKRLNKDVHQRVRFNERFYLHPTDQGFGEMLESGQGRCEDITNMTTFAARSMALATAADYTPYWGHRDNNHAWNVLLDADGQGFAKGNAHAAKVYRKTYAIQRDALPFQLPEGRPAPNRFMASTNAMDVTDQYGPTTDVVVTDMYAGDVRTEKHAYLCVFNGGAWKAIQWAPIEAGRVTFRRMGRNICYLPAVHDGDKLVPLAPPRIVHRNGVVQVLAGSGGASAIFLAADMPKQRSVDTGVVTPKSFLKAGQRYTLFRWDAGWSKVSAFTAAEAIKQVDDLAQDGLYWLVREGSRKLERIFTIEAGAQRWW